MKIGTTTGIGAFVIVIVSGIWFFTPSNVFNGAVVTLNPYNNNPLVAEVVVETALPSKVRVTVHGRNQNSADFSYVVSEFGERSNTIPIIGLYEGYENNVTLEILNKFNVRRETVDVTIQTDVVEKGPVVSSVNFTEGDIPFFLIDRVLFDQEGYRRWHFVKPEMRGGVFPLSGGLFAAVSENQNEFIILNVLGKEIAHYNIENQIHHEIIEKTPGGNLLIGSNHAPGFRYFDTIIELERESGEIVKTWDMRDYFDEERLGFQPWTPTSWFHLNSIQYDPSDNTLLISARTQNVIAKIDYDGADVKWMLVNHEHWKPEFQKSLLTPTNFDTSKHKNQDWTYLQHTASVLPNGNILAYDNGAGRPGFGNRGNVVGTAEGGYARVVEYAVDPERMTVTKVFEYSDYPDRGSLRKGSVYPFGDKLFIGHGEFGHLVGIEKASKEKLFEMHFTEDGELYEFYRAYPTSIENFTAGL